VIFGLKYALKLFYFGERYYGFQRQPHVDTVEAHVLEALKNLEYFDDLKLAEYSAASRTDRKVSALSQVISFKSSREPNIRIINVHLPEDIKFWAKAKVDDKFNPRRSALFKEYKYFKPYEGECLKKVYECLKLFEGHHDFTNFSKNDGNVKNPYCNLYETDVSLDNNLIVFRFKGDRFLWQMVRRIVGAINLYVNGKLSLNKIKAAIEAPDRIKIHVPPAPPEGLLLYDIGYSEKFTVDNYAVRKLKKFLEKIRGNYMVKYKCAEECLSFL